METVCFFHNYGFCKYRETCRKIHYKETCGVKFCETPGCAKRHPQNCKYFTIYNRCKFGTFCSYAHVTTEVEVSSNNSEDEEKKAKIAILENRVKSLEDEIKHANAVMKNLVEKNEHLENKIHEDMKVVCENIVKKATNAVVESVFKQQDTIEKTQKENFDNLSRQLAEIIAKTQPPTSTSCRPSQPGSQLQESPQPSQQCRFQCDICGKTFGSGRALANHERKDHEPNQNNG